MRTYSALPKLNKCVIQNLKLNLWMYAYTFESITPYMHRFRRLDCWDLLARGYIPANKHYSLFSINGRSAIMLCADVWSLMMMIAFIIINGSLVPLIEGLCSSNPLEFEFSGFRRIRTDDLGINSPSLWALTNWATLALEVLRFMSVWVVWVCVNIGSQAVRFFVKFVYVSA